MTKYQEMSDVREIWRQVAAGLAPGFARNHLYWHAVEGVRALLFDGKTNQGFFLARRIVEAAAPW